MKLEKLFSAIVNIGKSDSDDDAIRLKKHFFVTTSLVMCFGSILGSVFCSIFGISHVSYIPLSFTALTLLNLLFYGLIKNFLVSKMVQVFMSLMLPFCFQIALGGIVETGGIMLWTFLAIVGSMTYLNTNQSIIAMCLYLTFATSLAY